MKNALSKIKSEDFYRDIENLRHYKTKMITSLKKIKGKEEKNKTIFSYNKNPKNKFNVLIIIIFLSLQSFSYQINKEMIYSYSSSITITIQGSGTQNIFFGGSSCNGGIFSRPNEIYINNVKQTYINAQYDFNNPPNIVKLVWYNRFSNCNCLFQNCINIIDINFSEYDFSLGLHGYQMFYNCKSLTSLNFNAFSGKINIYNAANMFSYCESLTSIDLSKFDISAISDTSGMFRGCHSLISLDLQNFVNSNLHYCQNMFNDCPNLIYVNLINAHYCNSPTNVNNFVTGSKNIVFCTQCSEIQPIINSHSCAVNDCTTDWRKSQKKINLANNQCVTDCSLTENNKYLHQSKCYTVCPDGTYTKPNVFECEDCYPDCRTCDKPADSESSNCKTCKDYKYLKYGDCVPNCINGYYNDENDNSIKICKCDLIKCFKCSKQSFNLNLCITCNDGYYPKENDVNNINSFIDCYQSLEGYYLDNNNNSPIYKLCYESCSKCSIGGNVFNHNCNECKPEYYFELNKNGYKNCYINCPHYYYHVKNIDKYYCTEFSECPEEYSQLISYRNECIKKCEDDIEYIYEFHKSCHKECPEDTVKKGKICELVCKEEKPFELISLQKCVKYCSIKDLLIEECILNYKSDEDDYEIKAHDIMLDNIEHGFTSEEYDILHLEKGEEDIIKFKKIIVTLTTVKNQKKKIIANINDTMIDLKDCEASLRKANNIPDNEDLFIKKIDIEQEGMEIAKIEYDIYYKFNNTYLKKLDLSVCSNNKIDLSIPIVISEDLEKLNVSGDYFNDICYLTTSESKTDIILKDRRKDFVENNKTVCQEECFLSEYNNFYQRAKCSCKPEKSSFSFINMKINKTEIYNQFLDVKNLMNINIIFCYKKLFCLEGIIINISFFIVAPFIIFDIISIIIFCCKSKKKLFYRINSIYFAIDNIKLLNNNKSNKIIKSKNSTQKRKLDIRNNKKNKSNLPLISSIKNLKKPKNNLSLNKKANNHFNKSKERKLKSKIKSTAINNENKDKIKLIKKIMEPNIEEINRYPYELALKKDMRTYIQYYISLIKTKHALIFSFCYNNDYNSKLIKINLFFISFLVFFTVNALFFTDDTMHNIYVSQGSFDIISQLPQIVYSSLISSFLNILLKLFALSESIILEFKRNKNKNGLKKRYDVLKTRLKINFILYFILGFLLLLCFWYYLSIFGVIYRNTQLHLIKDTLISYGLSLIYPFLYYFIPGIFRMPAISNYKNKRNILYKISHILQMI